MLIRLVRASWALLALTLAACSGPTLIELDAGSGSDGGAPTWVLSVLPADAPPLALTPGDVGSVRVRLTQGSAGGPAVPGQTVSFALEGAPRDSSLVAPIELVTDAAGEARGQVRAGAEATAFRVRVSARGAASIYVDVAVSPEGFAQLEVSAPYEGMRPIARRVVEVHLVDAASARCETLGAHAPDRRRTIAAEASSTAFAAMPAGVPLVVVARAESEAGVTLAAGCVAPIMLLASETRALDVPLEDVALIPEGTYTIGINVTTGDATQAAMLDAASLVAASIAASGGDAAILLDALDEEFAARGATAARDRLAMDRRVAMLDEVLMLRLVSAGAGPSEALRAFFEALAIRLESLVVSGGLGVVSGPDGAVYSFETRLVTLGADGDDSVDVDLGSRGIERAGVVRASWDARAGLLSVEELSLPLPLGELSLALVAELVEEAGVGSPSDLLEAEAGCDVFGDWVASRPPLASACDSECALAACKRALEDTWAQAAAGAPALDLLQSRLGLSGALAASDTDGDLRVDTLSADGLPGRWADAAGLGGDEVSADASAARTSALP